MKKHLSFLWLIVLLIGTTVAVSSCKKDEPETPEASVSSSIVVNGTASTRLVFAGLFGSKNGVDFKQTVAVTSNVSWNISGTPTWLSVSPSNGSGNIELSIYPKEENNTASQRSATLTVSGDGVSATIEIVQEPGKPVCTVTPQNEVALYNSICWEYTSNGDVYEFQWMLLKKSDCDRISERELLAEIAEQDLLKYSEGWLSSTGRDSHNNNIVDNTDYYLITLANDQNGNSGELHKTLIKTPAYKDGDADAYVSFSNFTNSDYLFSFDVNKEGRCDNYHLIYGTLESGDYLYKPWAAFEIKYYLTHKKKHWLAENNDLEIVTNYPNNHTFSYVSFMEYYPVCAAYGWGLFKDGSISSDMFGFCIDVSESESSETAPKLYAPRFDNGVHTILKKDLKKKRS